MRSTSRKIITFVKAGSKSSNGSEDDSAEEKPVIQPVHGEFSDLEDGDEDETGMGEYGQGPDENISSSMDEDRDPKMEDPSDLSMDEDRDPMMDAYERRAGDRHRIVEDSSDSDMDEDKMNIEREVDEHLISSLGAQVDEEHNTDPTATQKVVLSNEKTLQKYGIGALLMKQMGYEEGKGIGRGSSGIIVPLDAVRNDGKLGVGAAFALSKLKEKTKKPRRSNKGKFSYFRTTSESEDYRRECNLRELDMLTFNIRNLVLDFSDLGVDAPYHLREWATSLRSTATEEDVDRLRYEYGHLEDMWCQLSSLNEKEKDSSEKLEYLDNDDDATSAYEKLLVIAKQWEKFPSKDSDDEQIEDILMQLSQLTLADDIFSSVALTILQPRIDALAKISLDDYDEQRDNVVPILNAFTDFLHPDISQSLYRYLIDCFSFKFKELLENIHSYSEIDVDNALITIISIWLNEGNSHLQDHVLTEIVRTSILPYLDSQVRKWDLLSAVTLPDTFFDLLDVIRLIGNNDVFTAEGILQDIVSKVKDCLTFGEFSLPWPDVLHSEGLKDATLQLTFIMERLTPKLESYGVTTKQLIQNIYKSSFAVWVKPFTLVPGIFEIILELSQFLTSSARLNILQFFVFNKWIMNMVKDHEFDPQHTPVWYSEWYQYFAARLKTENSKEVIDLIHWYSSKALDIIKSNFDPDVIKDLPRFRGELFPAPSQIFYSLEPVYINGTPVHRLQMTFRDVIEEYCMQNNIVMEQLKGAIVRKGLPIFKFKKKGVDAYGFIYDDVLWVSSLLVANDSMYSPISLDQLASYF
ncbi:hypothetical protein I9W82_000847 [Candida metapsilosis]|uniref:G-patch domain-containing protein n=1 Tax=Candida metapsilosis TaxID=273372 RepID=A0A8H7ZKL5_9ASCO|nr:hypothetical protein I9W82_000847 [Candida metapsilosis]